MNKLTFACVKLKHVPSASPQLISQRRGAARFSAMPLARQRDVGLHLPPLHCLRLHCLRCLPPDRKTSRGLPDLNALLTAGTLQGSTVSEQRPTTLTRVTLHARRLPLRSPLPLFLFVFHCMHQVCQYLCSRFLWHRIFSPVEDRILDRSDHLDHHPFPCPRDFFSFYERHPCVCFSGLRLHPC